MRTFENIVLRNKWRKVKKILKGGAERYYSSLSAITAYQNEDANLIFHDAVRPLVSQRIIDDVVNASAPPKDPARTTPAAPEKA